MSGLHVEDVGVSYGEMAVLENLDVVVQRSEVVALLGPSGSGKTTLLRVVAGLRCPDSGRIRWAGENLTDMPVHRRGVGLVFQDNALFPHRDVEDNVAFGLRVAGVPVESRIRHVAKMLRLVGLDGFAARSVDTLSGGEAQRIKLASELSRRGHGHTLYLMDEPTTGLHAADVHKLMKVINRLVDQDNTVVIIEHNLDVIKCADWVIDLGPEGGHEGGELIACGTPEQVAEVEASHTGRFLKQILAN